MTNLINKIIVRIKGEKYSIDSNIPVIYLVRLLIHRSIMAMYGYILFGFRHGVIFISPSASISCSNKITANKGLTIAKKCHIDALSINGIVCGCNVSIGKYTTIECTGSLTSLGSGLIIGSNVGLGTHGYYGCAGGIKIGSDTIIGNFVSMHSENHVFQDLTQPIRKQGVIRKGITVGDNCWIGSKATLLDGVIIEDGCIIAAGSVLTEGLYIKNSIYGGVPAKLIKKRV